LPRAREIFHEAEAVLANAPKVNPARAEPGRKEAGYAGRIRLRFDAHLRQNAVSVDPLFYAIVEQYSGEAVGYAAYLRIEPAHCVMEAAFSTRLACSEPWEPWRRCTRWRAMSSRTSVTAAMSGNAILGMSRRGARHCGSGSIEGIFREHMIVKRRNRDTAWFSMIDAEWPRRKAAFEQWLEPSNFDETGRQRRPLSEFA
jgi:hypothetical protein